MCWRCVKVFREVLRFSVDETPLVVPKKRDDMFFFKPLLLEVFEF